MASKPKPAPNKTPRGFRLHFCFNGKQVMCQICCFGSSKFKVSKVTTEKIVV